MNETIWFVGVVVIVIIAIAIVIPLIILVGQVWVSLFHDLKNFRQRRRKPIDQDP